MLRAMLRSTAGSAALLSCLLALLPGCGDGCSEPHEPTLERTTPGAPEGEGNARGPADPATPALTETNVAGEGGGVALRGEPDGRLVAIRLANTGTRPIELAAAISVEQEAGGRWTALADLGSVTLRSSCESIAPRCTTLAPGAELFPPAWLGTTGDSQCACEHCAPVSPGRYRFVVRGCDDERRVEGEPFTLE
jgi:hypothetical protein